MSVITLIAAVVLYAVVVLAAAVVLWAGLMAAGLAARTAAETVLGRLSDRDARDRAAV